MSQTILVVDDEPEIREFLALILVEAGYAVQTAADGVLALEILAEHPANLLILDVMMPRLGGIAVCEAVRAAEKGDTAVPIIMISADNSRVTQSACKKAGATLFCAKPMAFDVFMDSVRDLLPVSTTAL